MFYHLLKPLLRLTVLLVLCAGTCLGYEKRNLLQKQASLTQLQTLLVSKSQWIPYPAYADRAGWEKLSGKYGPLQIAEGEKYLTYDWKTVKATDYLAFERSGSRTIMETPFGANSSALSALVLAELTEGKGRFMDQIINGVWVFSEMTSWALSAHLGAYQTSKRALPDYTEHVIDLTAGDIGSLLAWTHYFFRDSLSKADPILATRLKATLQERILNTYMQRSDFWWQAFDLKPGGLVNNWNPWCNFNVLTCFLLLEDDPEKLARGVYRTMVSTDEFINYTHLDGACEEGPSYWGHAAGKLYDYLQLLSYATGGNVSVFNQPIIRNMGEYIAKSYVGNGWVVNFADASARGGGSDGLIFRYGKAVDSPILMHFAAYLHQRSPTLHALTGRDIFRNMEEMKEQTALAATSPQLPSFSSAWYPQTEFCYMKASDTFFAAKGGYNAESHNHNDMGTFSLYMHETPVLIDAGVGTYTRQTFSSERYSIWTMQSNYHNLPMINGEAQAFGRQYRSRQVAFDPDRQTFSLDLAGAYPDKADADTWKRTYQLRKNGSLTIEDEFSLRETLAPNQVHFMVWQKPELTEPGKITLRVDNRTVQLTYNPKQFKAQTESIPLSDRRLATVWGNEIYRIVLRANRLDKKGKYLFSIEELP